MRARLGFTLVAVAAVGACGDEGSASDSPVVDRWEVASDPNTRPDHVMIGPGAVIHAVDGFAEVARIPSDAGMLGVRVLDLGYWLVVTPSIKSCATSTSPFGQVELQFAVDVNSLIPVAKARFAMQFPEGTRMSVARGAPLRRLDDLRFELVVGGVGVPLRFELDPTSYFHSPDSVYSNRKPYDGYAWDWSGPLELELGPTKLRGVGQPAEPYFELVDRSKRRVELHAGCARISATIGGDAPLPPTRSSRIGGSGERGRSRLEAGTRLIWPTGELAGRTTGAVEVRRAELEPGLRCFEFEPFVLCVDPSPR